MLKYGNRDFRNLQEQVYANMMNIQNIIDGQSIFADLKAVKIVGEVSDASELPDPETYEGDFGDAYLVENDDHQDLYIFAKVYEYENAPRWVNVGQFPLPGPQGEQGIQGEPGIISDAPTLLSFMEGNGAAVLSLNDAETKVNVSVTTGQGLDIVTSGSNKNIVPKLGDGLQIGSSSEIKAKIGDGLQIGSTNEVKVKLGTGIHFSNTGAVSLTYADFDSLSGTLTGYGQYISYFSFSTLGLYYRYAITTPTISMHYVALKPFELVIDSNSGDTILYANGHDDNYSYVLEWNINTGAYTITKTNAIWVGGNY